MNPPTGIRRHSPAGLLAPKLKTCAHCGASFSSQRLLYVSHDAHYQATTRQLNYTVFSHFPAFISSHDGKATLLPVRFGSLVLLHMSRAVTKPLRIRRAVSVTERRCAGTRSDKTHKYQPQLSHATAAQPSSVGTSSSATRSSAMHHHRALVAAASSASARPSFQASLRLRNTTRQGTGATRGDRERRTIQTTEDETDLGGQRPAFMRARREMWTPCGLSLPLTKRRGRRRHGTVMSIARPGLEGCPVQPLAKRTLTSRVFR